MTFLSSRVIGRATSSAAVAVYAMLSILQMFLSGRPGRGPQSP